MLAIFFVRAVILVQTEHVNDNFQELLRFCLFLVSWLEDFCKDLVKIGDFDKRKLDFFFFAVKPQKAFAA
jgi:hypothetical protein